MEIMVLLIIVIGVFCYYENNVLDISKLKVKCNTKENIRVAHLSDLHSKEFGGENKNLIKEILNENPDIIFATGDMIDSNMKNLDKIINFLIELNKKVPVIYIPGNNEMRCIKIYEILYKLKEGNVTVLKNEISTMKIKSTNINILGIVEDRNDKGELFYQKVNSKYYCKDSKDIFRRLEKLKGINIVLSHYPENFEAINEDSYSKYKFDIMFSGHAHGGQFILPFIGGLFAPGQGILPKYYRGMYGKKNKLIVSRGLGNSGFPLRLFNRPEIIIVDIIK